MPIRRPFLSAFTLSGSPDTRQHRSQQGWSLAAVKDQLDPQRLEALKELRGGGIAAHPRRILFGRQQRQSVAVGLCQQCRRLRGGEAMMIGEGPPRGGRNAGG